MADAHDETERLDDSGEIFVVNATDRSVDIYVNGGPDPTISDPTPLAGGSAHSDELTPDVLVVRDEPARPYGMTTLAARPKGQPDAPVMAAASIDLRQGRSYTGIFHEVAEDEFQISIYENDLQAGGDARIRLINAAVGEVVTWRLEPNGENPEIPVDVRTGELAPGEWQQCDGVVDNDYRVEFYVDGQTVGRHHDIDLAVEKFFIVCLIGTLVPSDDDNILEPKIVFIELEFDTGPARPPSTTAPAPPLASTDTNQPIVFSCTPVEVMETDEATTTVTARDPDGVIVSLAITAIDPPVGGIEILDGAVTPSSAIGEPATAVVRLKDDLPPGSYDVTIEANLDSLAQHGACVLVVTVQAATVESLIDQVTELQEEACEISFDAAADLLTLLGQAADHEAAGDLAATCATLQQVLDEIGDGAGETMTVAAADALTESVKAARTGLDCG